MKSRRATQIDELRQHAVLSKEQLDDWLDEALAGTFPASDPVASPPLDAPATDRPAANQWAAGTPSRRSRR